MTGSDAPRFSLIGCSGCEAVLIYEFADPHAPTTRTCHRCETDVLARRQRTLTTAPDLPTAREQRARYLAARSEHGDPGNVYREFLDVETGAEAAEAAEARLDHFNHVFQERADAAIEAFAARGQGECPDTFQQWDNAFEKDLDAHEERWAGHREAFADAVDLDATGRDALDEAAAQRLGSILPEPQPVARDGEVVLALPGSGRTVPPDVSQMELAPQSSKWQRDLLEQLLDYEVAAVRAFVADQFDEDPDAWTASSRSTWAVVEALYEAGVTAREGIFAAQLARYALVDRMRADGDTDAAFVDATATAADRRDDLLDGADGSAGGLWSDDTLADGHVATLALADDPIRVRVGLDVDAWLDLDDTRTAQRALDRLATLSEACRLEILSNGPAASKRLTERYDLVDAVGVDGDAVAELFSRHRDAAPSDADDGDAASRAFELLAEHYSSGHGDLTLLAALTPDGTPQRLLADDPDVAMTSAGGVSDACSRLERHGMVSRDTDGKRKHVRLTELGEAAQEVLATDGSLRDPAQSTLPGRVHRDPSSLRRCSVSPPARSEGGEGQGSRSAGRTAETALAPTAPAEDNGFVQWLPHGPGLLDKYRMHQRYAAAARGTVACVDDRNIRDFRPDEERGDGRVVYASAFEDEVLLLVQWGGALETLGRITSALLDGRLLTKVLNPERTGRQWQKLYDGDLLHEFDSDLEDLIQRGLQIGWFSEEEAANWDNWADRINGVRAGLMEKVGELSGTDRWSERGDTFERLHGLLASTTALYHAAGLDIVTNVRAPDVSNILDDDYRRNEFLDFWRHTVPKQGLFRSPTGVHSFPRSTLEDDPDKLKKRIAVDADEADDLASEPTVQWVFSGRTATDARDAIATALDQGAARERVEEGIETAPYLDLDVHIGDSMAAVRDTLQEWAGRKDYESPPSTAPRHAPDGAEIERLLRLLQAALATGDQPHRVNPSVVAEAMMHLASSNRTGDNLGTADLEYALSQLPPSRLLPDIGPSQTRLIQALLAADEPLGRQELLDRTSVSESTYTRAMTQFRALDIIQPRERNGHRVWTATLAPWWTETAGSSSASTEQRQRTRHGDLATGADLAMELVDALDLDVDLDLLATPVDLEALLATPGLRAWRQWIWAAIAPGDQWECGPPGVDVEPDARAVRVGRGLEEREPSQRDLQSAAAGAGGRIATDGGKSADGEGEGS